MKETAKLLTLLSNPQVKALLDFKKLKASDTLEKLADFAAEHALASGDSTYIVKTLDIFRNTRDFDRLLKWFCLRTALESKLVDGCWKFSKSANAPNRGLALRQFLNCAAIESNLSGTPQQHAAKSQAKEARKKKKRKKVDLLDSWAVLPGSYGMGKRR